MVLDFDATFLYLGFQVSHSFFSQGHSNSLIINKGLCNMALLVTFSVLDLFLSLIIIIVLFIIILVFPLNNVDLGDCQ